MTTAAWMIALALWFRLLWDVAVVIARAMITWKRMKSPPLSTAGLADSVDYAAQRREQEQRAQEMAELVRLQRDALKKHLYDQGDGWKP